MSRFLLEFSLWFLLISACVWAFTGEWWTRVLFLIWGAETIWFLAAITRQAKGDKA